MLCLSVLSLNRVILSIPSFPNLYRYQNYIGSRILYPGHSEEQIKSVLQSEQGESERILECLHSLEPLPTFGISQREVSNVCLTFSFHFSLLLYSPLLFSYQTSLPELKTSFSLPNFLPIPSVKIRIQALATRRVETLLASHPLPKDPTEAKKLSNYALRKRAELELQLTDVARAMIEKSAARLDSLNFLKIFAVTVNNLLARMYHLGIHLNVHQVLEVRRVAAYAAERKQSIIFLPCHKRLV